MEKYLLELKLCWLPTGLNKKLNQHFRKRNEENQNWHSEIFYYTRGKQPPSPLRKCKISLVRYCKDPLDYDNLTASFKPIVDGLKVAGIIVDDGWKVTGKWDIDQLPLVDGSNGFITIRVEELECNEIEEDPWKLARKSRPRLVSTLRSH